MNDWTSGRERRKSLRKVDEFCVWLTSLNVELKVFTQEGPGEVVGPIDKQASPQDTRENGFLPFPTPAGETVFRKQKREGEKKPMGAPEPVYSKVCKGNSQNPVYKSKSLHMGFFSENPPLAFTNFSTFRVKVLCFQGAPCSAQRRWQVFLASFLLVFSCLWVPSGAPRSVLSSHSLVCCHFQWLFLVAVVHSPISAPLKGSYTWEKAPGPVCCQQKAWQVR